MKHGRRFLLRTDGKRLAAVLALALAALASGNAAAQVQRAMQNLSFEVPDLTTAGCRVYINASQVPGWQTNHVDHATENSGGCVVSGGLGTSPGPIIEIWRTPRSNSSGGTVNAPAGVQIAELNAAAASRIYQNVCLINGESVQWEFKHRGRGSASTKDVANLLVGNDIIATVGTTNTGVFNTPTAVQGSVDTPTNISGNATWVQYSGTFDYAGSTGSTSFGFEAVGGTTSGNLLDDIQIKVAPFVEFTTAAASTVESSTSNVPTLRVSGNVLAAFTITVDVTGGTATLGTDYLVNGGSSTSMSITVPAGDYDGTSSGSLFALPITIVNDSEIESSESITLAIEESSDYLVMSQTSCGGDGIDAHTYTIVDDDSGIALTKNAATPVAGSSADQFSIAYTIEVTNPSTTLAAQYQLVDAPGFDADVTIAAASYTKNGGTATALSGSGPWTLQSQWASLAAGATDTYVVTVTGTIAEGGSAGADACSGSSGAGLYNLATATVQGTDSNTDYTANACQPTPTPYWVTLAKDLQGRASSTDQAQVRIYAGGISVATATTSGSESTATAATSTVAIAAGTTLQFGEAIKANGTGSDTAPNTYANSISCSNVTSGSTTSLPSGAGTVSGTAWYWPVLSPVAGDDISCTITNRHASSDLSLTKAVTPTTTTSGGTVTFTLTVNNTGAAADGAVVTDPAVSGLTCPATNTVACTASGSAACPSGQTVADLQGSGIVIPTLPSGGSVVLTFECTAD
ncbi:MAG: hypothetical protein QM599_01540 [Pseudoxanthomonas sp.]